MSQNPPISLNASKDTIKKMLSDLGLTQTHIAKELGISYSTVHLVIKGYSTHQKVVECINDLFEKYTKGEAIPSPKRFKVPPKEIKKMLIDLELTQSILARELDKNIKTIHAIIKNGSGNEAVIDYINNLWEKYQEDQQKLKKAA